MDPTIVLYDVKRDHKVEDLKDEFLQKNFDFDTKKDAEDLRDKINFKYSFRAKNVNQVNWVVQLPEKFAKNFITVGRVFAFWRSYRIKEYINILRCYRCHGYGHMAKVCNVPKQLCDFCGNSDHDRKDCKSISQPSCINCKRYKRKEVGHVRHLQCPEYLRQLDLYNSKIKWS